MRTPPFDRNLNLFLLGTAGLAVLPHIQHISMIAFGFFMALLAWRSLGVWRPACLPGRQILFLLLLLGVGLMFVERQGILGRDAGSSLLTIALGLKLMEMKKERDFYLIIYMTFVVAATHFLYEQNMLLGVYVGLVCCLLLALLIAVNGLQNKIAQAVKLAGLIILQAAPLAAAMFILFPRLEAPKWMAVGSETKNRTGLSEIMEPGSITNLSLSDEVVFRAQFEGPIPPPQLRYWRGPVMSITNGKLWTQTQNLQHYASPSPKVSGQPYRYTMMMEPQRKNWVFALDMPVGFSAPLTQNANLQLLTAETPGQRVTYKLTSYPAYTTGSLTLDEYRDAIQLPGKPSARIKEFVHRLHAAEVPTTVLIQNLLDHFRKENFRYTLAPPKLDDNPIESFLFDTRAGFCSHYASAFVYLLRAAHIPARIVTGYQGGELNDLGHFIQVRQADAHAWAEVWLENQGWVRFDPTAAVAPERIEYPLDVSHLSLGEEILFDVENHEFNKVFSLLKRSRLIWGSVDYKWQRWIIDYNSLNQTNFLSELGIEDSWAMGYWLSAIVVLISLLSCVSALYHRRRKTDPVLLIYARFCDKLAKMGVTKGTGEGAKDFSERAKIEMPAHAAEIDRITESFLQLRYGRHPSRQALKQLKRWIASFNPK